MNDKGQNPKEKKFDLEERTGKFGEELIKLVKEVPQNTVTIPLIDQLIRSGTSIGANYCEADGAESGRDFYHITRLVSAKKKRRSQDTGLECWQQLCQNFKIKLGY